MPPPTPPLTEDDPAERKSRHLALAQNIQQMAMTLTRSAFDNAAAQLQSPEAQRAPGPGQARPVDHALAFTRLARTVQAAMILEARAAHDDLARRPRPTFAPATATPATPDSRRPLLRQALHRAVKADPDSSAAERAQRRREIDAKIDQELTADPARHHQAADLLVKLSAGLAIHLDPKDLSDDLLGLPPPNLSRTAIPRDRPEHPLTL